MRYYAVKNGRQTGIVTSWAECEASVKGYSNAIFKSFKSLAEAKQFLKDSPATPTRSPLKPRIKDSPKRFLSSSAKAAAVSDVRIESSSPVKIIEPLQNEYLCWDRRPAKATSGRTIVYTDGACSNNGYAGSKAGCGIHFPGHPELSRRVPLSGKDQTNQRAELEAIRHALIIAKDHPQLEGELEIRTDSQYAIKGLTEWCVNWEKNNWDRLVKNRDLFEDILKLRRERANQVYLRYVRGHSGEPGNEEADRLAVEAIQLHRP